MDITQENKNDTPSYQQGDSVYSQNKTVEDNKSVLDNVENKSSNNEIENTYSRVGQGHQDLRGSESALDQATAEMFDRWESEREAKDNPVAEKKEDNEVTMNQSDKTEAKDIENTNNSISNEQRSNTFEDITTKDFNNDISNELDKSANKNDFENTSNEQTETSQRSNTFEDITTKDFNNDISEELDKFAKREDWGEEVSEKIADSIEKEFEQKSDNEDKFSALNDVKVAEESIEKIDNEAQKENNSEMVMSR